jgi:CMP-2-keto-3-deoxyoctulosonic acid synthetase
MANLNGAGEVLRMDIVILVFTDIQIMAIRDYYPKNRVMLNFDQTLEQLRWLEMGITIGAVKVLFDGIEINTPKDLTKWKMRNSKE